MWNPSVTGALWLIPLCLERFSGVTSMEQRLQENMEQAGGETSGAAAPDAFIFDWARVHVDSEEV